MIIGMGIDTVSIYRINKALARWGVRFKNRIFTKSEIVYCDKKMDPAPHYASRFAAKEAFYKALGSLQRSGIRWKEIEVDRERGRAPSIRIHGIMEKSLVKNGRKRIFLSMSHDEIIASATVIIEENK